MAGVIDTGKVAERRQLHFGGFDDILAEVDRLAASRDIRNLGNWSPGQIFLHLALVMEKSIDGYDNKLPGPLRWLARLFLKRRFLTKPMPPGFKLPRKAAVELGPPATSREDGLASIRRALGRLKAESKRARHPIFGPMTADEWVQLHCRHSEMHLSFLVPLDAAAT